VQSIYVPQADRRGIGNILFTGTCTISSAAIARTIAQFFTQQRGLNTIPAQAARNNYRTFPSMLTGVATPGLNLWSMSVIKATRIREK